MLAGQSGVLVRLVDLEQARNQSGDAADLWGMGLPATPAAMGQSAIQTSFANPQVGTLTLGMTIVGDDGTPMLTLGEFMEQHRELQRQVKKLKADITAQGGVVLGEFSSPSEDDLTLQLTEEMPSPDCISAFVDPISIFAHNKAAYPAEDKAIKDMLEDLREEGMSRTTDKKFVATFFR